MPDKAKDTTPSQRFTMSPKWSVISVANGMQINAGDDMVYDVACDDSTAHFFCDALKSFTRADLPVSSRPVFEQLLSAEVILPVAPLTKKAPIRLTVLSESKSAAKQISADLEEKGHLISSAKSDLIIVVRTTKTLTDFLKAIKYKELRSPHLFVDLAYHHTISIGPLVFPGDTPCVACLEGRLLKRWGSQTPPKSPRASKDLRRLAVELAELEIMRYKRGDTSLAFKTVAYDTDQRSVESYKLLTVPQCPYCLNACAYANGRLVL